MELLRIMNAIHRKIVQNVEVMEDVSNVTDMVM